MTDPAILRRDHRGFLLPLVGINISRYSSLRIARIIDTHSLVSGMQPRRSRRSSRRDESHGHQFLRLLGLPRWLTQPGKQRGKKDGACFLWLLALRRWRRIFPFFACWENACIPSLQFRNFAIQPSAWRRRFFLQIVIYVLLVPLPTTSTDVTRSRRDSSLEIKVDSIAGRLNRIKSFRVSTCDYSLDDRMYQCGINHKSVAIAIESTTFQLLEID